MTAATSSSGTSRTDERCDGEDLPLDVAEGVDAAIDRSAHPERLRRISERDRLDDEERVAAGEPAEVLGLRGARRASRGLPRSRRIPSLSSPAERDRDRLLGQVRYRQLRRRMLGPGDLVGPVGADHEQRQVDARAGAGTPTKASDAGIGPLQIVEQHARAAGRSTVAAKTAAIASNRWNSAGLPSFRLSSSRAAPRPGPAARSHSPSPQCARSVRRTCTHGHRPGAPAPSQHAPTADARPAGRPCRGSRAPGGSCRPPARRR